MSLAQITKYCLWPLLLCSWSCSYLASYLQPQVQGNVVRTATSTCTYLDRDNKYHPLYACETAQNYEVRVMDQAHRFAKPAWQAELRVQLARFAEKRPQLAAALAKAQIEIWLTAPALQPELAALVAFIKPPAGGGYGVRLPFLAESWAFDEHSLIYAPSTGDGYQARVFSFPFRQP